MIDMPTIGYIWIAVAYTFVGIVVWRAIDEWRNGPR